MFLLEPSVCSDVVSVTENSVSPASLPAGFQKVLPVGENIGELEGRASSKPRDASLWLCLCLFQQPLFVTLAPTRHFYSQWSQLRPGTSAYFLLILGGSRAEFDKITSLPLLLLGCQKIMCLYWYSQFKFTLYPLS